MCFTDLFLVRRAVEVVRRSWWLDQPAPVSLSPRPVTLFLGAGLSITAPIALFRSARSMYHSVRCLLPFGPNQSKCPANHPSFNEALNLRSRGPWGGMRAGYVYVLFVRIPSVFNLRE